MYPGHFYRLLADEREREVREMLRIRALLKGRDHGRSTVAGPPAESRARGH